MCFDPFCSLNAFRIAKSEDGWQFKSCNNVHNHPPMRQEAVDFSDRTSILTEDHKDFIRNCAKTLLPPADITKLLLACFPDAPALLTRDDVRNVAYGNRAQHVAQDDANNLLQILFDLQREDPRWFVKFQTDEDGRLTHLFWQSPDQREAAADLYQVIFHDNTYKTNRFKLPFGVFAGINRHGHTVTLATCLTFKEGTTDYEWAYGCYQESVGIDPECIFTDADPGASAAVRSTWPSSFHGWCLWHLYINVTKNLSSKLGAEFTAFLRGLKAAQRQLSKRQFWLAYDGLKRDYPLASSYLDEQLTPNVKRWAAFALETFTGGAESTQRGEGLNFHIKRNLDMRSSLMKVFEAVSIRTQWEDARRIQADIREEVNYRETGTTASSLFPDAYQAAKARLTPYALQMICTQVQAATKYQVFEDLDCEHPLDVSVPQDSQDPNLVDLPRFKSAKEMLHKAGGSDEKVYCITLRWNLPGHLKNPHFVVLKCREGEVYTDYWCTCGASTRAGIPCRHYWAVLLSDYGSLLCFHFGLVNELWFMEAQPATEELQLYCMQQHQTSNFSRPMFQAATARAAQADSASTADRAEDPKQTFGRKRLYGELLGLCKKAVEACLAEGTAPALRKMMLSFVPGGDCGASSTGVANPAVAKSKGRPKGAPNKNDKDHNSRPCEIAAIPNSKRARPAGTDPHQRRCGACKDLGHDKRSCPTLFGNSRSQTPIVLTPVPLHEQAPIAPSQPNP